MSFHRAFGRSGAAFSKAMSSSSCSASIFSHSSTSASRSSIRKSMSFTNAAMLHTTSSSTTATSSTSSFSLSNRSSFTASSLATPTFASINFNPSRSASTAAPPPSSPTSTTSSTTTTLTSSSSGAAGTAETGEQGSGESEEAKGHWTRPPRKPQNSNNSNDNKQQKPRSSSSSQQQQRPRRDRDPEPINQSTLMRRVIHVRRVSRTTKGGKVRSVTAIVIVGNGNGSAGYGEGKAPESAAAVQKATRAAIKNMVYVDRYDGRTVFSDIDHKFKNTRVLLWSAPPGYGIVTNPHVHEVCRCVGITDIAGKIRGSMNPINVVKATIEALTQQKKPTDIAKARGMKVMDVQKIYYGVADSQ